MTYPVITLAEAAFDLDTAVEVLRHHRIQYLPMVDSDQRLTGLVTRETLQHALLARQLKWAHHQRAKLTEMEQRYVNLTDAAPVGIFHTDAQGRYTTVTKRCPWPLPGSLT